MECDGVDCTTAVSWDAIVADANCNMQAHIAPNSSAKEISITLDTKMTSKYDDLTAAALNDINGHGWGKLFVPK